MPWLHTNERRERASLTTDALVAAVHALGDAARRGDQMDALRAYAVVRVLTDDVRQSVWAEREAGGHPPDAPFPSYLAEKLSQVLASARALARLDAPDGNDPGQHVAWALGALGTLGRELAV